ncbi:MAG: leucine-rich repeat protein [Clostridia bacterium]|nr:leucine-rich repeat protein [Clostridia bacterium]
MNHYDAGTTPWYEYRYQIETVVLENGVTVIGNGAFTGCIAIHSILIPDSVTMLGDAVFEGCDSLTAIYFAGSEAAWQAMTAGTDNPKLDGMNVIFGDALPNTVTVWITGVQSYTEYNGEEQRIFGYNVETSNPFYTVNDIAYTGNAAAAGTDAGTYPMGLRSDDFENLNPAYDVTFEVTDGMLHINPAWITVLITGNEGIADYDGEAHEVTGYDIYFGRDLYREEYIRFTGNDTVSGTGAGTYYMGLSGEDFSNTNENFDVTFQVTDGRLTIRKAVSINLSISPETPVIGQEMTISWDVACEDFVGCGISVYLRSGQYSKSITLPGVNYHEKHGSCTFTPTAGEYMTIYGNVYSGPGENGGYTEIYIDQIGPFALQGEEDPSEMVRVDVTYDAGSVQTGETITANYRITGGSGDYDSITAYWYRIGNAGQTTILQFRDLQEASGELSIAAQAPGEYALVFYIRDEKGWDLYQTIQKLNHRVTVTGEPVTGPLGIDFYNGLPSGISRSGQTTINWDITGGDGADVRKTMIHAETDNGISLMNTTMPGFSNGIFFSLQFYAGTEDSQSVTFTMTPMDSTATGEPVTFTIPILAETEAELLLPASLERIEAEAFADIQNVGIYIPNTVTYIAEDAFDSSVTIFCEEGSYAESRCRELGLKVITVEWGNG